MNDGPLQILFCANSSYFQHVAVAAVSLAENNKNRKIDLHLITCEIDHVSEHKLRNSLFSQNNLCFSVHYTVDWRLDRLFIDKHISKEAYLRILAPEVLPSHLDRIIYIDSDVVVLDDLQPLWDIDLGANVLAAAPDYPRLPPVIAPERRAALGIPQEWTYVNSGVLLLDVARWRRERLTERLFDYIDRHGPALEFWDQDAINAVLHQAILVVDCRWNLQARMYRSGRRGFPMEFQATQEARRRPAIVHFTGSEKPWLLRSRTARKGDYFRYLDKTAWRGALPPLTSTMQRLEYRADRLLSKAGIDYLQVLYEIGRAPAKLGMLVAALAQRACRTTTAIVGRAASAWGTGRG
jgi:lipopolysaccharide biosynthesis glycosyltransferase